MTMACLYHVNALAGLSAQACVGTGYAACETRCGALSNSSLAGVCPKAVHGCPQTVTAATAAAQAAAALGQLAAALAGQAPMEPTAVVAAPVTGLCFTMLH